MDLNFLSGLGCGICIGISIFAFRKYFGTITETAKAVKKIASDAEYKLVLVVRTDLNMGKGKIAAQCCHAAVGAYEKALKRDPEGLKSWQMTGQAKIALKTDSVDEIKQIADNAKKMGLVTSLVRDAGRTQIAPNSITVLGVGPAPKDVIDKVTGHLKLL
ncbi:peptidyl-tRNA hydrolase 2, mitochondrial-like [Pararge aegeria]|uniref:peptidyl-tRNA hydrolase n=1 Tax=Pararge aegeria aegeria TaxID=348720 RepID=A0A8S4SF25_9NEOP|nr:peptidyl-tRNA hydrolase 2, mitochondrial-like [Pararge aegeria]CAH2266310.1 jg17842 [Pararge aegeria aegeria]